jgi:hypothetical protein
MYVHKFLHTEDWAEVSNTNTGNYVDQATKATLGINIENHSYKLTLRLQSLRGKI